MKDNKEKMTSEKYAAAMKEKYKDVVFTPVSLSALDDKWAERAVIQAELLRMQDREELERVCKQLHTYKLSARVQDILKSTDLCKDDIIDFHGFCVEYSRELRQLKKYVINEHNLEIVKDWQSQNTKQYSITEKEGFKEFCKKFENHGYLIKQGNVYRRNKGKMTKAQFAYALGRIFYKPFPDKELCEYFGETRLSKALSQLADNTHDGKPKGYKEIDKIFNE